MGLVMANTVFAAGGPPFKAGEVVVKGAPYLYSDEFQVKKYLPLSDVTVLEVGKGKERAAINKVRAKGRWAQLNLTAKKTVDDPFRQYQWNFDTVQAETAWAVSTGEGVKVAVLDTGLVANADDGVNVCATGQADIVNNDSDPEDGDGHGTHVSGTIAQITDNGIGVAGLAHGACVMPVKVLDDSGSGSSADIAEGIRHAVANGAQVINMSLGYHARYGYINDSNLNEAMTEAEEADVLLVVAAGNDGWRKNVSYPALHAAALAVGATDYLNQRAPYSNRGTGLDVMAPGGNTGRDDNNDSYGDGILQETHDDGALSYYFFQGTSMAAPHVAALAALIISDDPSISLSELKNRITSTTLDLGSAGYDSTYGHGLIQAGDALGGSTPPPVNENIAPTASFTFNCNDLNCSFDASSSSDSDGDIQTYSWAFGNGATDSAEVVSYLYPAAGTYDVTLTVIDNDGAYTQATEMVVVSDSNPPPSGDLSLTASGYKVKGVQHVRLTWDGIIGDNVDIYRNGSVIGSPSSTSSPYIDRIGKKGGGSYTYKVCEAGFSSDCSPVVTVTF